MADVIISTWTAANVEIKNIEEFLTNGKINNLNFIVDRSFQTRQKKYYDMLLERFGDIVAETSTHAKFILIKNNEWNIVIRTSMNLNENKRMENFEISDCKVLYCYLETISKEILEQRIHSQGAFKKLGRDERYKRYMKSDLNDEEKQQREFLRGNENITTEEISKKYQRNIR